MATRYVNTASTPGGDGTTNATAGANRAYASLSEWEAARQAVLSDIEEVVCDGSTADTAAVTVDGWTATSTHYILIRGSAASSGFWDTSKYRLSVNGQALRIDEANTFVRDFQAEEVGASVAAFRPQVASIQAEWCIFRTDTNGSGFCVSSTGSNIGTVFRNCLLISRSSGGNATTDASSSSGSGFVFYNCTVIGSGSTAFSNRTAATNLTLLRNCLVSGFTTFSSGAGFAASSNYNATDLASATGGANDRVSQTFTFVNAGSGDYHLDSGDAGAKDFGEDLSGLGFTTDIDGVTRSGTWDIGADETSGGSALTLNVSDSVTFTEAPAKTPGPVRTDAVTAVDARAMEPRKPLADAITAADAGSRQTGKNGADNVVLAEVRTAQPAKAATDSIMAADGVSKLPAKSFSENITWADSSQAAIVVTINVADAITLSDSKTVQPAKGLSETLSMAEGRNAAASKPLTDAVSIADSVQGSIVRTLSLVDALIIADSRTVMLGKRVNEPFALGDARLVSAERRLADALAVQDSVSFPVTAPSFVRETISGDFRNNEISGEFRYNWITSA